MRRGVKKNKVKAKVVLPDGTIRIKVRNLTPVKKEGSSWGKTKDFDIENIKKIAEMYRSNLNFDILVDTKDPRFLKGFLTPEKQVRGERIGILPDKRKLNKAFSLFSPHLTFHDEKTEDHWDVIFQNPNGEFAHLYAQEKLIRSRYKKYQKVKVFKKIYPKLKKNLEIGIKNNELMALPLFTLIMTQMRIGNIKSYKEKGHKGLTTLEKRDITLLKNKVKFCYIGKDGVPQETIEEFPSFYILQLSKKVSGLKNNQIVFTDESGKILRDTKFEDAFKKYSGIRFYPHIVRSYYATEIVQEFLKKNKNPNKRNIIELYNNIAERLGHKKFSKAKGIWLPSHSVTVSHYINPELVEKLNKSVIKAK